MVRFLDKDYDIPKDLEKYLELLKYIENMRDGLILSIKQKVKSTEGKLIGDEEMLPIFKDYVSKIIQMLCDNEIFNRTIDDYLTDNKGYELFTEANKLALEQFKKYLINEMEAFMKGMQAAEDRALSSVTGSPVRVWTSSFVTLAASAAYDYSCAKDQMNKANEQYKKEIDYISSTGSSAREKNENNYLNKIYFPSVESAMSLFAFSIMDKYIADLIDVGKFNKDALQYVDFKKSQGLLDNLSLSSNKNAILNNAFVACPFNGAVYEEAAKLGLCDIETLKTANKYCPNNKVIQEIIDDCEIKDKDCDFYDEYNRIKRFLPIIAEHLKLSESDAARAMFKVPYKLYENTFSYYESIVNTPSKRSIKELVSTNIAWNYEELYSKTNDEIRSGIFKLINKTIRAENFNFLCELGYDFSKFGKDQDKQSVIEYWTNSISDIAEKYISECKSKREKLIVLKSEYDKDIQKKSDYISSLEQELSGLGVFSFSKKRDIKERIEKAKAELYNFSKQAVYVSESSSFDNNYI